MMKIDFEDHCSDFGEPVTIDDTVYLSILSKIYDQILYQAYQSIQLVVQEKNNFNFDSSNLIINTIREESSKEGSSFENSGSNEIALTSSRVWDIVSTINFDHLIKEVLYLYEVNYVEVDWDSDLLLRKMHYVFLQKPTGNPASHARLKQEIAQLKQAN